MNNLQINMELKMNPLNSYRCYTQFQQNWKKIIKLGKSNLQEVVDASLTKIKHLKKTGKFFYWGEIKDTSKRPEKSENKWKTVTECNINEEYWRDYTASLTWPEWTLNSEYFNINVYTE